MSSTAQRQVTIWRCTWRRCLISCFSNSTCWISPVLSPSHKYVVESCDRGVALVSETRRLARRWIRLLPPPSPPLRKQWTGGGRGGTQDVGNQIGNKVRTVRILEYSHCGERIHTPLPSACLLASGCCGKGGGGVSDERTSPCVCGVDRSMSSTLLLLSPHADHA